jgi:hypothetical protein
MIKKYRDYVRTLPCCVSGYEGDEISPHHIIGYAWLTGKCTSKKGSDLTCIPLRQSLHQELHDNGYETFEKKYNVNQVELIVKTILQAEKDGII